MNGVVSARNPLKDLKSISNQNLKIKRLRQKVKMARRPKTNQNQNLNLHHRNLLLPVPASKVLNRMISGHSVYLEELAVGGFNFDYKVFVNVIKILVIELQKVKLSLVIFFIIGCMNL